MKLIQFLVLAVAVGASPPVIAHEMFLKPKDHTIPPGSTATIKLVNGTFYRSENVIDRDRMRDVTIYGGGKIRHPLGDQWRDQGLATILTQDALDSGTYAIGVSTMPRDFSMTRDSFIKYLRHEGVMDTLADFQANSTLENVRERYAKHVRTIVQVGETRSDEYGRAFGYPVEILLETNPHDADVGDEVGFQVLRNGVPLPGQLVYASYGGYHAHNAEGDHERAISLRTDADGQAGFTVSTSGIWYLTLIHMEARENDPDVDYESNWATLTFAIN
ncbi:MAG: DUF4198 domain-containing protein [Pseudomonadota bacterium]